MLEEHTTRHIAAFVRSHLALQPTAGISVGITDRHQTLFSWSYGFANLEAQLPLTPAHLLQIGSIGKSFTSLVLMQLYEEGRFDPQAPVQEYLPWLKFNNGGGVVTGHHLLTHTGGLIQGTDEAITAFSEAWLLREVPTLPPGKIFHYSNTGYKILGLVIEALTGRPWHAALRTRILEPLGMEATEATITHAAYHRHARGYEPFPPDRPIARPFTDKTKLSPAPWLETDTADGSITSTPGDMAIYVRALANGFAPLIRPDTFDWMTSPHTAMTGDEAHLHYGYGLDIEDVERVRQLSHGGGMVGYTAFMLCRPDPGYGVIVLTNGPGNAGAVARFALAAAIAEVNGESLPEIPSPVNHFAIPEAHGYAGEYHGDRGTVRIEKREEGLGIEGVKPGLALRAPDCLHLADPAWDRFFIRVRRDESGAVEALEHGGEVYYRGPGRPDPRPVSADWAAYPGQYITHNPWYPGFRIVLREDRLVLVFYYEGEETLTEIRPGEFRIGEEGSPETIRFEVIQDGLAYRAIFSGAAYQRKIS